MNLPSWRGALLAGCLLILGGLTAGTAATPQEETAATTNLPKHVTIKDGHGNTWADLSYATDAYEYYHVYSPETGEGGELRSDRGHTFRLNGPESWGLEGNGKGFTLVNGEGEAVYRVERWGGVIGDASGPTGTFQGVYGDWKVMDMHRHPLYFLESMDHDYDVLDGKFHLLSCIKPGKHNNEYVVMDKGNKTWWTYRGHNLTPLSASFMAIRGVSPWARVLMGAYFFPDWW